MKILIVTHYFPPEVGAPQARLSDFARLWSSAGDDVTVLTGLPNHPSGVVPEEYRGRLRWKEEMDGFSVVRTWLFAAPNTGVLKRTLAHLSFMMSAMLFGTGLVGRPEVVVVSSPTFFSILSAWFIARRTRARLVVEVRDLWPAVFVELGVIRSKLLITLLERLELMAYRAADAIVVVTEGFRADLTRRGVPGKKVQVIRNGVDLSRFDLSDRGDELDEVRRSVGAAPDECLVLYLGAHGISHGLDAVIDAARELVDEPVHIALVGDGASKGALVARARRLGLENLTMVGSVPRLQVPAVLAAADICLVPLRDVGLFSTFIPSKTFEYFAAGRAVIGAVRGEPAAILREGGALVVEPEDGSALAAAIRELAADPERREEMGRAARTFVEERFDRRDLAASYRTLLHNLSDPPPSAGRARHE